ncbi:MULTISPECIES: hypothetical protein [unclassified Clostridium]|uniref:hypothetical protein n=1 Tax=unclassified Clostridium TaxID=2614128 RepID=UPI002079268E|nr:MULTISPECIES: hypothetical protein [unclassified Clostridium]
MDIEKQLKEAKDLLKVLEWYDYDTKHNGEQIPSVCPICANSKKYGHSTNCKLGILLAEK